MKLDRLIDNRSVAIIGNSGCELGKGRGAIIDAHDVVFRFNEFSLDHVLDYGTKTTAWITAFNGNPSQCQIPIGLIYCPLWLIQQDFTRCWPPADYMPRDLFDALYTHTKAPSTGMAFLWWIASLRTLASCSLYGFSFFDPHDPHHYWENVRWPLTHDRARELEMFRDLYNDGVELPLQLQHDARALLSAVQGGEV